MIINLSTQGDASLLIDEQQISGDPKNGIPGKPQTIFQGGYNSIYYPLQVIFDLGSVHQLSDIYVFDKHNTDTLTIYSGTPQNWQNPVKIYLTRFNGWLSDTLNVSTRYIMLEFPSRKANIAEIILYGQSNAKAAPIPSRTIHKLPLVEDLIGINGLNNQPVDKLRCVGSIREYHQWRWDEGNGISSYPGYPNNQFAWAPSWVSGANWGWNFDQVYSDFRKAGIDLSPCLQQTAPYMLYSTKRIEQKPISLNDNPLDPNSYEEHARYLYQFTARYGSSVIDSSKLMLRPGQPIKSGMNLVKYVENWNEQDKWWRGRDGYFSPFEMAAMCSADYDGHEGSMGPGYGAKNADPNIKFVMGGLTTLGLDYIKSMKLWSDFNRNTGFPADVLNFHHYSNTSGGQDQALKKAISPEEDKLKDKLKEVVEYRDHYLPGKEIWLSEFGYDTNPNSPQGARAIGQNDVYEVQAQWLLRSYLEIAAAGIDRAHAYFFSDINAGDPNKFNSCGLVNEKWFGYQPKTSWYYIYAMKKTLQGYRFTQEEVSGNPDVNIYKFDNESTSTSIYVAWCNTSIDQKLNNFSINLSNSLGATLLELSNKDTVCNETGLVLDKNSNVSVNLSERPIFIRTVNANSANCIEMATKGVIQIQLDKQGQASIVPLDIDNGTKSNCGPLSFNVSKNSFDCSDITAGSYLEIHSDSTWTKSTVTDQTTNMRFPWTGVSGNLPPKSTFTSPVILGQPKSYKSIDNVPGSEVIKCENDVTFYRKTFTLTDTLNTDFFIEMTVDDDMEVYLNGNFVAREQSHKYTNATFPSHRFHSAGNNATAKSAHESFDMTAANTSSFFVHGTNEIILAIRNTRGLDNGGFSFRMGIGNPTAAGHKVTLTANDNFTLSSDTGSTLVQVIDILGPSINLVPDPVLYLGNTGTSALTLNDLRVSIDDNCHLQSVKHNPESITFSQIQDSAIVEIVSDNSWYKSTFRDSRNAYTYPWAGVPALPDSTSYSIPVSVGQPYNYQAIYPIEGAEVISTDQQVTFFKKTFILNVNTIKQCWIDLTVDDDVEIYVNGHLLVREGSFSAQNSQAPAHRIHYSTAFSTNGYQGGDAFDFVSSSNLTSILNPNGKNEIIFAVRNGGNNNVGGFSFKLSIPLTEKYHIPATIMATDKYGNISTAHISVEIKDTIPPTLVVLNPVLLPDATGLISLNTTLFDNGSYDNTSIKSLSVFPSTTYCQGIGNASFSATDYFGNTSITNLGLQIDTALCPNSTIGSGKKSSLARDSGSAGEVDYLSSAGWSFNAYPLPADETLNVNLWKSVVGENMTFEIRDLSGRLLISESKTVSSSKFSTQLNLSELAQGKYLLSIKHTDQSQTIKILVN